MISLYNPNITPKPTVSKDSSLPDLHELGFGIGVTRALVGMLGRLGKGVGF